jgi:hypothetical protein
MYRVSVSDRLADRCGPTSQWAGSLPGSNGSHATRRLGTNQHASRVRIADAELVTV